MKRMQLVAFLIAVVFLQVLVALPFVVDQLGAAYSIGARYSIVGWLIGSSSLFYAGGSLLLHRFVLHFGQRRVLWMVFPGLAACTALFLVAPNIPSLFVIVAILSVVLAMFWISMECAFSFQEGDLRWSLARYCMSWSLGDVVGAWLGTALVARNLKLPFLVATALVLACWALVVWLERSGRLDRAYAPPVVSTRAQHEGERFLPATRTLFFFVTAVVMIMYAFVPLVVAKEFTNWGGLSSRVISLQPLLQCCVFVLLGRWGRWVYKTWPLWVVPLLLIAATTLLALAVSASLTPALGSWFFKIGLSVVGMSLAFSFLLNLLYSFERPETRAKSGGIHEAVLGFGSFLGPLLAGYGADFAGRGAGAFWVAGALATLGLVLSQAVWLVCSRASAKREALS